MALIPALMINYEMSFTRGVKKPMSINKHTVPLLHTTDIFIDLNIPD